MAIVINTEGSKPGKGLVPTIRAYAPEGSTVTCAGQEKVVGAAGYVDFVVSADPRSILPEGVQGLEHIESTGTQWIDTGLKDSGGYGFESVALTAVPNINDAKHRFVGANGGSTPWIQARFAQSNFGGYLGGSSIVADNSIVMNKWYKLEMGGYTFGTYYKVDGIAKYTGSGITSSQNKAVYLFAQSVGNVGSETPAGGTSSNWVGKMQYSKFFGSDGLTLTRDYIPAIYNGQVGMWDIVTNAFFGNAGTGSFIAGDPCEYLEYPTYTVTATLNGKTVTEEVTVDEVGLFGVELEYIAHPEMVWDGTGTWVTIGGRAYNKVNDGDAICGAAYLQASGAYWTCEMLVSRNPNSVAYYVPETGAGFTTYYEFEYEGKTCQRHR